MDAMGIIRVGAILYILSHHELHSLAQEFCWPTGKSHIVSFLWPELQEKCL